MKLDSLQSFDESGEEVGHSAADLRAVVSQSSLVQKRHLSVNTTRVCLNMFQHTQAKKTALITSLKCVYMKFSDACFNITHQNIWDVLRLHDEEFIVSNHSFKKLLYAQI